MAPAGGRGDARERYQLHHDVDVVQRIRLGHPMKVKVAGQNAATAAGVASNGDTEASTMIT